MDTPKQISLANSMYNVVQASGEIETSVTLAEGLRNSTDPELVDVSAENIADEYLAPIGVRLKDCLRSNNDRRYVMLARATRTYRITAEAPPQAPTVGRGSIRNRAFMGRNAF